MNCIAAGGNSGARMRLRIRLTKATALAVIAVSAGLAQAQYAVQEWANFEDGKLPDNCITIGPEASKTLKPAAMSEQTTQTKPFQLAEVGKGVLELTAAPDPKRAPTWQTGLAIGKVLDRTTLGPEGRALFQADFYFPESEEVPSVAVMAMEPPAEGASVKTVPSVDKAFYRLGCTLGNRLYFSCRKPDETSTALYFQDEALLKDIPRGAWHRFAVVCEGPETIRCYVDGREAAFSPIKDTSLKSVMVGMLLAESKRSYTAYADNLSIQVSTDAPALPESPYNEGWKIPAGPSAKAKSGGFSIAAPALASQAPLDTNWLLPTAAWTKSQKDKVPLMLYFYAPGIPRVEKMNDILNTDPAAKAYAAAHACAKVDVNQLEGGSIAKQYNIYKVPALLVVSPDAKQHKRVAPGPDDTWAQIAPQLAPL